MKHKRIKSAIARCALAVAATLAAVFLQSSPVRAAAENQAGGLRRIVALDGMWQIAEGGMTNIPTAFEHSVPVPGLVSLATPPFIEPGPRIADRRSLAQKDPRREAFWYRRTFKLSGPIPAVATIKISKAMFGARVFLNGQLLGDHAPCFTPGYFNAKGALKIGGNELIVRIGADRDAVGRAHPDGFDFEKERYIPGIFDTVQLVLSGTPNFESVQVAPDITARIARVQARLRTTGEAVPVTCTFTVREAGSGKVVGRIAADQIEVIKAGEAMVDVKIPIAGCRLWSPEDPFLYTLEADSGADSFQTRFGMREFRFDPATGRAMLNGRPYFMRGSNITLYRFFEDSECGNLPWNKKWVRLLHQRVKDMRWNCLRYCIGFPPEAWYDMADQAGILIDDEFPIWFGRAGPKELQSDELAEEYSEWMRERWNHPCLAIWDACNETLDPKTGAAIRQVRALDLSNRPWDDGYSPQQQPGDSLESHPYHFNKANFNLASLATADPVPQGNVSHNDGTHAVVINEYGWLWLNRDGTPTTLTRQLYQNLLGTNSKTAQRFHTQALCIAAETEFWRAHRHAAAVMHFTTLGYSRPDGQTSDHWTKGGVAKLQWEPEFHKYVREAFAPVGMMMDFWTNKMPAGTGARVPVVLINDLYQPWNGPVTLRVKRGGRVLAETKQNARIEALGRTNIVFDLAWPEQTGPCVLETELRGVDGEPVHSVRETEIVPRPKPDADLPSNYGRVCEPVVKPAFLPLPIGAVQPQGWLRDWAMSAREGITGHLDERHPTFADGWKGITIHAPGASAEGTGWPLEQSAYWLDGALRLGLVLHDEALIKKIRSRLDPVVEGVNNAEAGATFIYWKKGYKPQGFDSWAHSQMGRALVALYQGTGDKRVLDALVKVYADYPENMGGVGFSSVSGLCNLDAMLETYSFSGDHRILDRALGAIAQPAVAQDFKAWEAGQLAPGHMVILYENTRLPAIVYPWTGDEHLLRATLGAWKWLDDQHMLPYGVASGEEFASGIGAFRKTETCDVTAMLLAASWLYRIQGAGDWGDRMERAFFNAGAAPVARDFQTMAYYQSPNRLRSDSLPSAQPHCPGADGILFNKLGCPEVLCCVGAVNRIIPNYIIHMWMATRDNGLAATLYGPCTVSALAGDGVPVTIDTTTDYPFGETILMRVDPARKAAFPLYVRIPGWCRNARITVNGSKVRATPDSKGFVKIARIWNSNDLVELLFPMKPRVIRGYETEVPSANRQYFSYRTPEYFQPRRLPYMSVFYGPLLFSLPVADVDPNTPAPHAKWQYALDTDAARRDAGITVERKLMPRHWDWPLDAPVVLTVAAQSFDWQPTDVQALPDRPVSGTASTAVRLVPYGCTKFRVSMFPVTERAWKDAH